MMAILFLTASGVATATSARNKIPTDSKSQHLYSIFHP